MKKISFLLMTLICSMTLFVACSSDGDDDGWKELTNTYSGEGLTINNAAATDNVSVQVTASNASEITLVLKNYVLNENEVTIKANLTGSGDKYTLSGEDVGTTRTVKVTGTFSAGVLNLAVERLVTSSVVATWNLNKVNGWPEFIFDTPPAMTEVTDPLKGLIAAQINEALKSLTVTFQENGTFKIAYEKTSGEAESWEAMFPMLNTLEVLNYFVSDPAAGKLSIALDSKMLEYASAIPAMAEKLPQIQEYLQMFTEAGILTQWNSYYIIELNYSVSGSACKISLALDQAKISKLLPLISQFIPEEQAGLIEAVLPIFQNLTGINIGLGFTK